MSIGRVLILDHSREHARFISDILGKKNWGSILNFDVKTALRTLEYEKFDLLIVDATVNGVNVLEAIENLRTAGEGTPIAVMSSHFMGGTHGGKAVAAT